MQFYCNSRNQDPNHFKRCFKCVEDHIEKENVTIDKIDIVSKLFILGSFSNYIASNYNDSRTTTLSKFSHDISTKLLTPITNEIIRFIQKKVQIYLKKNLMLFYIWLKI